MLDVCTRHLENIADNWETLRPWREGQLLLLSCPLQEKTDQAGESRKQGEYVGLGQRKHIVLRRADPGVTVRCISYIFIHHFPCVNVTSELQLSNSNPNFQLRTVGSAVDGIATHALRCGVRTCVIIASTSVHLTAWNCEGHRVLLRAAG